MTLNLSLSSRLLFWKFLVPLAKMFTKFWWMSKVDYVSDLYLRMWPKAGESFTLPLLSKTIWEPLMLECVMPSSCRKLSPLRIWDERIFRDASGREPIDWVRFSILPLAAKSETTETQPSGLSQKVSKMRMKESFSLEQNFSQILIHALRIFLISLFARGTSLTQ